MNTPIAGTVSPLFNQQPPRKILLITLRYLGDTLLTTPLINSLKAAYPDAQIDVLVYENTKSMLQGNPAISKLIGIKQKPSAREYSSLFGQIFRQYDLAVSTQTSDKAVLFAVLASSKRIGFAPPRPETGWFKRYAFTRCIEFDTEKTHTVLELLKLCDLLPIPAAYELTPPSVAESEYVEFSEYIPSHAYAVLHVMPQWKYKEWTREGWIAVANFLHEKGITVVLSGSPLSREVSYLEELKADMPEGTINLAGKVTLPQLSHIIAQALLYIGVDTGTTHLASATKTPTIALFGPSDPVKWAPWPAGYHSAKAPFETCGQQRVNNVALIQGPQTDRQCVPCYLEGCLRNRASHSDCLDQLSPKIVMDTIELILREKGFIK